MVNGGFGESLSFPLRSGFAHCDKLLQIRSGELLMLFLFLDGCAQTVRMASFVY